MIAFPLAAGLYYPFTLSPEVAARSMAGSSAVLAVNALMLKRTKLADIKQVGSAHGPGERVATAATAAA